MSSVSFSNWLIFICDPLGCTLICHCPPKLLCLNNDGACYINLNRRKTLSPKPKTVKLAPSTKHDRKLYLYGKHAASTRRRASPDLPSWCKSGYSGQPWSSEQYVPLSLNIIPASNIHIYQWMPHYDYMKIAIVNININDGRYDNRFSPSQKRRPPVLFSGRPVCWQTSETRHLG